MNLTKRFAFFAALTLGLLCSLACGAATEGDANTAISRLKDLKESNSKSQKESQLRQEFFDRVIFQINTHFKSGSLHDFLAQTFNQMAERQPSSPMYDFLMQAAQLLRLRQEKFENPIELTNRFLQAGGILTPMTAEQFLSAQAYTNGERSESVTGMNREELGEFVDHQTQPFQVAPKLKNVEIRE